MESKRDSFSGALGGARDIANMFHSALITRKFPEKLNSLKAYSNVINNLYTYIIVAILIITHKVKQKSLTVRASG